jgi:hypothetical protein
MECSLLHLTGWATAHSEPTPGENAFMRLKRHEFFRLFIQWDGPECIHCIHLQEVFESVKLFDLVSGEW